MRNWLLFPSFLAGCSSSAADCDPPGPRLPLAVMTLSEAEIDFGRVARGESVVRTVHLTNDGAVALGISELRVGDEIIDFEVAYDLAEAVCAWVPDAAGNHILVLEP